MMDLESIEQLSREAGKRAAEEEREPLIAFIDKDEAVVKCPNLGDYVPDGWKLIDRLFVDKFFSDDSDGRCLSVGQFIAKVKSGLGYAIIEEGQFQLYIGVFEKVR